MTDDFAKLALRDELRDLRAVMVSKLDGLSEYDIRRPLTATGTNLLGLVKHLSIWESIYLGDIFDRPLSGIVHPQEPGTHLWATADETRAEIIDQYRRVGAHADATIDALDLDALDLDARGHVAWWPRPNVTLLDVLAHRIAETARHVGHADILREQLDGTTGDSNATHDDPDFWTERNSMLEDVARTVAQRADAG